MVLQVISPAEDLKTEALVNRSTTVGHHLLYQLINVVGFLALASPLTENHVRADVLEIVYL